MKHDPGPARPDTKPRRRWFRISLGRLLVLLGVMVALVAWLGEHVIRTQTERPIVAQIEAAGGAAFYDYQLVSEFVDTTRPPNGPSAIRAILGDDIYATVKVVSFNDERTTDADLTELHRLTNLEEVTVTGMGITDDCIEGLLRVRQLNSLGLIDTSITAGGLAHLAGSPTLRHLTLHGSSITDAHLKRLADFSDLHSLQIIRAPVTDEGIASLGGVNGLRKLELFMAGPEWPNRVPGSWNSEITDAGFQQLGRLKNLGQLKILATAITDESLAAIANMKQLKSLQLNGHSISDEGVAKLSSLESLELLHLATTNIGDRSLETISQLNSLQYLDVSGTSITDAGLRRLSSLSSLERLDVCRTMITDQGLAALGSLTSMRVLDVELDKHITRDGVDKLKAKLPSCEIRCWDVQSDGSRILVEMR